MKRTSRVRNYTVERDLRSSMPAGSAMSGEIGSILLGSTNPERLADWYCAAFGGKRDPGGPCLFGDVAILFEHRDDVSSTNAEPGRHIVNFGVEDAVASSGHLDSLGVKWLVPLEERKDGWFGTIVDPDGNYVQIIQFKAEYLNGG
jgi:hypothetical protein